LSKGDDLRVCGRIFEHLHLVVTAPDDASISGDESPDRNFTRLGSFRRQAQRFTHERSIIASQEVHGLSVARTGVFCFTKPTTIWQSYPVRFGPVIVLLLTVAVARGQEQERKLVNRLLEPNMKLENSEQNKQYTGAGGVTAKSASTRSFYASNTKLTTTFAGTREFATRSYPSRQVATQPAILPPPQRSKTFDTADARGVKSARESSTYRTRQFAGSRSFVEQGKSQKSLHQQNHPLSIDDVRELLNKNK
jgi:hypothetical protein